MGFIDYKGNKEDNYSDVVNYAHMQQKSEANTLDHKAKSSWLADKMQDDRYASLQITEVLRLIIQKAELAKENWQLVDRSNVIQFVDCIQLFSDLWLNCVLELLELFSIEEDKKVQYLQTFIDKILKIDGVKSSDIVRLKSNSQKYKKYLYNSFSFDDGCYQFWKMVGALRNTQNKDNISKLVDNYLSFECLTAYYLYLGLKPNDDSWMAKVDSDHHRLITISNGYGIKMFMADFVQMKNPVYGREALELKAICNRYKCILFNFDKREEDISMYVEELYISMRDGKIEDKKVSSILPADILTKLKSEVLTEFSPVMHLGLKTGEKLYYMNNAIFYYGNENNGTVGFSSWAGKLCVTNMRLFFDSEAKVSVSYEKMLKVVQYDAMPNILQIDMPDNQTAFFQVSDGDVAYRCLKMVSDARAQKKVNVSQIKWNVDELIKKSDLDTYAFVFEYMKSANMPDDLKLAISSLAIKIKGLKKTLEDFPEQRSEIGQFMDIYIPNALRFLSEYIGYEGAPIEKRLVDELERKVKDSILSLDAAIETKISQVYGLASLDTMAQADGLRNLLGLKGYVNSKPII